MPPSGHGPTEAFGAWTVRALVVPALILATAAIVFSGGSISEAGLLFVFPVVLAFYRLAWAEAVCFLLVALIAYDLALNSTGELGNVRLLITGISLTLVGVVVRLFVLRERELAIGFSKAAITDHLTGLTNRRGFEQRLDAELARARRDEQPLALLVADLDDFKAVNDQLGHLGGDMALERASGVITATTRGGDDAARIGGEEFALIVPGCNGAQGLAVAERLRTGVEQSFSDTPRPVTASIGIASFPADGETVEDLLHAADRAMYAAKELGKNQCVVHGQQMEQLLDEWRERAGGEAPDSLTPSGS